eukprot:6200427-Pleurochrysis_carterae.AAC.1
MDAHFLALRRSPRPWPSGSAAVPDSSEKVPGKYRAASKLSQRNGRGHSRKQGKKQREVLAARIFLQMQPGVGRGSDGKHFANELHISERASR